MDSSTGAVQLEFAPAMMWNTRYGMRSRGDDIAQLTAPQARAIAEDWAQDRDELSVADRSRSPATTRCTRSATVASRA